MTVPPFSLDKDRYDQSTLSGRVLHFYSITDARTLFLTKTQLENAQKLIGQYKTKSLPPNTTDADLWKARKITDSVLHPVTGQPINPMFRFAAYAPMNVFIVTMMLLPSTINSVPRTIFIHWFNQSYNCAVNFANRSGEKDSEDGTPAEEVPVSRLMEGYFASISTSLSIALGATVLSRRASHFGPKFHTFIRATVPFTAVVLAGCANILLMRRSELTDGVPVFDDDGNVYGKSVVAGKVGLAKCCSARFLWNVPGMVVPGFVLGTLASSSKIWNGLPKRVRFFGEVGFITVCLWLGVPPALALFPQIDCLSVNKLEPHFQNLYDKSGQPITHLYYNKGL